jgi:hypothetical protein
LKAESNGSVIGDRKILGRDDLPAIQRAKTHRISRRVIRSLESNRNLLSGHGDNWFHYAIMGAQRRFCALAGPIRDYLNRAVTRIGHPLGPSALGAEVNYCEGRNAGGKENGSGVHRCVCWEAGGER